MNIGEILSIFDFFKKSPPASTPPNSAENWDALWTAEGLTSWRGTAMAEVYDRLDYLIPPNVKVLDIGGGVGILAKHLQKRGRTVEVWDISKAAVKMCRKQGIKAKVVDLLKEVPEIEAGTYVVATEVLEHLPEEVREKVIGKMGVTGKPFYISVPNDRLGPEEEPQHTIQYQARDLKQEIQSIIGSPTWVSNRTLKWTADGKEEVRERPSFYPSRVAAEEKSDDPISVLRHIRVEVLGPRAHPHNDPAFLLAVVGEQDTLQKVSLTLPVRDEGADLGRVLASFRGSVDEIVVGVDPRTKDNTWEVASRYADKVFYLVDPEGPVEGKTYTGSRMKAMAANPEVKRVPEGGCHFSWVRNQCMDNCSGEWIFMTEGHELLVEGFDTLRHLHLLPEATKIVMVWRSDVNQRWAFPWLHRNLSTILYERSTHNSLSFPDSYMVVKLPEIRTLHDRVHAKSVARKEQRKIQNRVTLQDDWMTRGSEFSKYYLASEWREFDSENGTNNAEKHFRELLALPSKNGSMRYQARLILAKLLGERRLKEEDTVVKGELLKEIREILFQCSSEDWSRTEHWLWLGDLATEAGQHEEAVQFYTYGAARIGNPPFSIWWMDNCFYTYLPCQRLAMAYGNLGNAAKSLYWAREALVNIPPKGHDALIEEAQKNIEILEGL